MELHRKGLDDEIVQEVLSENTDEQVLAMEAAPVNGLGVGVTVWTNPVFTSVTMIWLIPLP